MIFSLNVVLDFHQEDTNKCLPILDGDQQQSKVMPFNRP